MDRTAPTILPLNLNRVIGTAAARFSVDARLADQISADDRILSGGRKRCGTVRTRRRWGAHPLLQARDDNGADRLHGGWDRSAIYFATCPLPLKKPGQNRAMGPTKEKENETD
jgi:hypothetical protein